MKKKLTAFSLSKNQIKITPLRRDILSILSTAKNPLSAYDVLEKLKKIRKGAEPPTVYRVLDFLEEAKMVHRIQSQKTYVCCSQRAYPGIQHETVLLFCRKCKKSFEYEGKEISRSIKQFAAQNKFIIDDTLIEIKGTCHRCSIRS